MAIILSLAAGGASAFATSNRGYGPNEYTVINGGLSPNRKYSIAAQEDGELGYDNLHIYLMNAVTTQEDRPARGGRETLRKPIFATA